VSEAAFFLWNRSLNVFTDSFVIGVDGGDPHPASDAVDVRIDGKDAAASARKQEYAVCGLWTDPVHRQ
jgi:hypothetical protein